MGNNSAVITHTLVLAMQMSVKRSSKFDSRTGDSDEAVREIEHWFKPEELVNYHTLSEKVYSLSQSFPESYRGIMVVCPVAQPDRADPS